MPTASPPYLRVKPRMSPIDQNAPLQRLLAVLHRSLPMFLAEVGVWTRTGDERATQALGNIVADQKGLAARVAELILQRTNHIDVPPYPIGYADAHFLSLDSLLNRLQVEQRGAIAAIEASVDELASDPVGRSLAEEALGSEKAHLETLEEIAKQPA